MGDLPLIDISTLRSNKGLFESDAIEAIGKAFHEIGFIAIRGHGVPESTIAALRKQTIRFFDRPLQEKLAGHITQQNYRGYIPLGFFTPNAAVASTTPGQQTTQNADLYEAYKLHTETDAKDPICAACALYGPHKWPSHPAELKNADLDYLRECDRVSAGLLNAVADFLGVSRTVFQHAFTDSLTNMTLLHYPARKADQGRCGIHPHKDTDVLTILAPDPVGGLWLRPRNSEQWISADAPADALIVNVGDMLEIWSDGYFVSTPHKVINPPDRERYSFPYFAVPRFDILVEPLLISRAASGKPGSRSESALASSRRTMKVGDVSAKIWQSNWPNAEPVEACYDPYIS
ncbi:MAG: isopenicillin N synthase family oxygenase [Gammaproteobacteria bacterium]|nr:isopenicillin N synthase family oxygenase [Gammaproteobacteria bacterium]